MKHYDVFNGDADGICALHQLRLAEPLAAELVTGVKRDIALLARVPAHAGDRVTVCDISLDSNRDALLPMLARGVHVAWFDHHFPGELPASGLLDAHIDTAPTACSSLIVDRHLGGCYRGWAVAAAFGDGLVEPARQAAEPLALTGERLAALRELGECLNYNAYGDSPEDLHFHPAELFRKVSAYSDPFSFIAEEPAFAVLRAGYRDDLDRVRALHPEWETVGAALFILPAEKWARRASGVFANLVAQASPQRAHAVLTLRPEGGYVVSVRAPLARPEGADALCRQFPTGGGRRGAGGVNHLPEDRLEAFVAALQAAYPGLG